MKVKILFEIDNAAFQETGYIEEIVNVLKRITKKVDDGDYNFKILDSNGNAIGRYSLLN